MNDDVRNFIDDYFVLGTRAWLDKYVVGGETAGLDPEQFVEEVRRCGRELLFFDALDWSKDLPAYLIRENGAYAVYSKGSDGQTWRSEFDDLHEAMIFKTKLLFGKIYLRGLSPDR